MEPIRHINLRWLKGRPGDARYEVTRYYSHVIPTKWQPAINAFRCENEVKICVELAGVAKSEIDLMVESRRVVIRGTRVLPEPAGRRRLRSSTSRARDRLRAIRA